MAREPISFTERARTEKLCCCVVSAHATDTSHRHMLCCDMKHYVFLKCSTYSTCFTCSTSVQNLPIISFAVCSLTCCSFPGFSIINMLRVWRVISHLYSGVRLRLHPLKACGTAECEPRADTRPGVQDHSVRGNTHTHAHSSLR